MMSDTNDYGNDYDQRKRFYGYNNSKNIYCNNCGNKGHYSKKCTKPITSYGIILINIFDIDLNKKLEIIDILNKKYTYNGMATDTVKLNDYLDINTFCKIKNVIQFLLVSRKHSIGYTDFLRGRYKSDDNQSIISLFKQMLEHEKQKLTTLPFKDLWDDMWSTNTNPNARKTYKNDFIAAQKKFEKIKNVTDTPEILPLQFYVENVATIYTYQEWGFPKGRKNIKETNIECAIREFVEETNIDKDDINILDNIEPIEEIFIGTDGITYKYIYYVGMYMKDTVEFDVKTLNDIGEIGDISWFGYDNANELLRTYHISRKHILTNLHNHFLTLLLEKTNLPSKLLQLSTVVLPVTPIVPNNLSENITDVKVTENNILLEKDIPENDTPLINETLPINEILPENVVLSASNNLLIDNINKSDDIINVLVTDHDIY